MFLLLNAAGSGALGAQRKASPAPGLICLDQTNGPQADVAQNNVAEAGRSFDTEQPANAWSGAIESLKNEISDRHYSKKTWKAYSLWAEKLRYYVKEKPPETLRPKDVKDFLTFLAVKKKVSASSQNQAINALLFFFRPKS